MLESIFYAVLLVLILAGIVSIINFLLLKILMPRKGGKYILLVPPDTSGSDVAGLVYLLSMRFGVFGNFHNVKVTVVDCGMSEMASEMCRILCDDGKNIEMCNCDEICDYIKHTQLSKDDI
ncbi:MAG: hypothetical protein RR911_00725 [Oscillospiraceae bacterium]